MGSSKLLNRIQVFGLALPRDYLETVGKGLGQSCDWSGIVGARVIDIYIDLLSPPNHTACWTLR
jgi:hypothetical protein